MRKIKFYDKNDLSIGLYLEEAAHLILNFKDTTNNDINSVLELYNCIKFIENELFLIKWTENYKDQLKAKSKEIFGHIARYFNTINYEEFYNIVKGIEYIYREDFLELLSKFNLMTKIEESEIELALEHMHFNLSDICAHEKLVKHYSHAIRRFIMKKPSNLELILDHYVVAEGQYKQKRLYFPDELTAKDMHILIVWYIECQKVNPNYLELIINNHNTKKFSVPEQLKWLAKIKLSEWIDNFFRENKGIKYEYILKLKSNVDELIDYKFDRTKCTIIIDEDYLNETLDNPSILNNFIWLFGFVDLNMRMTFVSKESDNNLLIDTIFNLSSKNDYLKNTTFTFNEQMGHLFMSMYYEFLKKKNIHLESVIQWFFEEYLEKEFGIRDYKFSAPSKESSYREKCRDLLAEFEYILLQYKCYVEYNSIIHELLELSSGGTSFKDIPSLIQSKYVYPTKQLNRTFNLLFSNQTNLGYLDKSEKSKSTFYELISKEDVNYREFEQHQLESLEYLFDAQYIIKNKEGNIEWLNPDKIKVLKSLYKNGVKNFKRSPQQLQDEILKMEDTNELIFESSLLTRKEQDLLDYYLNNSKFQNGPQIRNKYSHGRVGNKDEQINYDNYLTILRIVILVVIKINDDVCLSTKINGTN